MDIFGDLIFLDYSSYTSASTSSNKPKKKCNQFQDEYYYCNKKNYLVEDYRSKKLDEMNGILKPFANGEKTKDSVNSDNVELELFV